MWRNCSYRSRHAIATFGIKQYDVYLDRGLKERCRKVCRDYLVHRSGQYFIRKFSYQNGTCAATEENQYLSTSKFWRLFSVGKLKIQNGSEKSGLNPATENWYGQKLHASLQQL